MSVWGALASRLGAVSGVTDLVSTRIYNAEVPQGAVAPYVVYVRTGEERLKAWAADGTQRTAEFQVDSWALTAAAARALAEAVSVALNLWSGSADSTTVDIVRIENEIGPVADEPDYPRRFRVIQEYTVWYRA